MTTAIRDNYLVEHTASSIIGGAFKIYFRHFGTLFLIYVLPVAPVLMIYGEVELSGNTVFIILSYLLVFVVSLFAQGATTVAVSDVCLGNAPSFKRSYAKILGKLGLLLLVTSILQALAIAVGMVLLIPGMVLSIWLLLSPSVVVLERRSGVAAMKRSKQLGDGSHWRNFGLVILLSIIMLVSIGVIVGVFGFTLPHLLNHWIFRAVRSVGQVLVAPLMLSSLVLVYYDRRVRKEGYDAMALAEDLAR